MSRIFVSGVGSVSPAGWGMAAMRDALKASVPLPTQPLERPGWSRPLRCRPVPDPATRPAFLGHPRLRRTSPITHYAAAAALEALSPPTGRDNASGRVGMVACVDGGCVQYSCRFFEEVLKDPAIASPLVFPETVFAALGSSVAALLTETPVMNTLIGDSANFLQGLSMGAEWLLDDRVDTAVVIGAEEINWVLADALWHLDCTAALSAGAGAVALVRDPARSAGVELTAITNAHTYSASLDRQTAAENVRDELPAETPGDLLCDSLGENQSLLAPAPTLSGNAFGKNRAETAAWDDWRGPRLSIKQILGEGLVAAAGWQCTAAVDAILAGAHPAANVSVVGTNQQAIGARFSKAPPPHCA
jgi:hypothetical protein